MLLEDVRILNNSLELIQDSQNIKKSIWPLKQEAGRGGDLPDKLEVVGALQ